MDSMAISTGAVPGIDSCNVAFNYTSHAFFMLDWLQYELAQAPIPVDADLRADMHSLEAADVASSPASRQGHAPRATMLMLR